MAKDAVVRSVRASEKAGPTKGDMVAAKAANAAAQRATTRDSSKRRVPSLRAAAAEATAEKGRKKH